MFHRSLFSITRDFDIILALYSDNRYELEIKYTTMIDLGSRPTLPRVDLTPLASYLNKLEDSRRSQCETAHVIQDKASNIETTNPTGELLSTEFEVQCSSEAVSRPIETEEVYRWHCDRLTDSGPILRLNSNINKLSKAARYGHPYERPIYSSSISPSEMKRTVTSFYSHAYALGTGFVVPKKDHEWSDIHEFNKNIDWTAWTVAQSNIIP